MQTQYNLNGTMPLQIKNSRHAADYAEKASVEKAQILQMLDEPREEIQIFLAEAANYVPLITRSV